jgi:hypothetical protein
MAASHYHVDETRLVPGRAMAYTRRGSGLGLDTPNNERAGAGGVFTNVRDLLKWDENFYQGRVGGPALLERLHTVGTLNDGKALDYAWGLQIGRYRGLRIVEHGGSLGGYRAHLLRFPDEHFSVAALCNLASIAPGNLARQVADVSLAAKLTESKPGPTGSRSGGAATGTSPSGAAPARTVDLAGRYYSDEVDAWMTVALREGRLTLVREADAEPAALEPVTTDRFRFRGMTIRFVRNARNDVEALLVDAGRVRDIRFARAGQRPIESTRGLLRCVVARRPVTLPGFQRGNASRPFEASTHALIALARAAGGIGPFRLLEQTRRGGLQAPARQRRLDPADFLPRVSQLTLGVGKRLSFQRDAR